MTEAKLHSSTAYTVTYIINRTVILTERMNINKTSC